MMKSFCIKTNYQDVLDYLLKRIEEIDFPNLIYSKQKFKIYENIMIHYRGKKIEEFRKFLSSLLCEAILKFYEEKIIKHILNFNYFYFEEYEKMQIYENCNRVMQSEEYTQEDVKQNLIESEIEKYLSESKSIVLDGFVRFRLKEYLKYLDNIVDIAVNQFVIEKEYNEFINLLRIYIESKPSQYKILHLIYMNGESILLDDNKNIVTVSENIFNAKYLSDISFSSNDFALNTLLTLLPEKIEIHLIDEEDEFISTLKLIFEGRISICKDCNICRTYKLIHHVKI